MGMYTEILIKADVKGNLPDRVRQVLEYLFNQGEKPFSLPVHPFFQTPRWEFIGNHSSYYHIPWPTSRYEECRIFSRSDLKNYNDEIAEFFNWIRPYLNVSDDTCIGWTWYEEDLEPTLVYMKESI